MMRSSVSLVMTSDEGSENSDAIVNKLPKDVKGHLCHKSGRSVLIHQCYRFKVKEYPQDIPLMWFNTKAMLEAIWSSHCSGSTMYFSVVEDAPIVMCVYLLESIYPILMPDILGQSKLPTV